MSTPRYLRAVLAAEEGAIRKDWGGRTSVALVYPNTYFIGMSSLGFQAVYALFNAAPDFVCERAFALASRGQPRAPLSVESGRRLSDFDVVAFSISFEPDYFHLVAALREAGIPLLSRDRDERHPLVIAGGPAVSMNPEPTAPFFDAVVVGEGEPTIPRVMEVLRDPPPDRARLKLQLAAIPGVYVPDLYQVDYAPDGSGVHEVRRQAAEAAFPIQRQRFDNLEGFRTTSVVLTRDTEFGDAYLIEVARGCPRLCRFCLAGYGYLPKRERSVAAILAQAREGLAFRRTFGLVSPSVSDHSRVEELVEGILDLGADRVTLASLRIDAMNERLLRALARGGARTLTFAPEAGSERMRAVVRKDIVEHEVLDTVELAASLGIKGVKLYYMIGLPGEEDADVQAIVDLSLRVKQRMHRRWPGAPVKVSVTPHVPKPHTAFQWAAMAARETIERRQKLLKRGLAPRGIEVETGSAREARVQGVLARGDRRLAAILQLPAIAPSRWEQAMREEGLDPEWYLRERAPGEATPWDITDLGMKPHFPLREWERARARPS